MISYRILIVEDEVLIAEMLRRYLCANGHQVVGTAASYNEAIELFLREKPDLILLDIQLNGPQTGIDFAHFVQSWGDRQPVIYLTSQMDKRSIQQARQTFPAGYLAKPIHKESLYTTIEMAMYRHSTPRIDEPVLNLPDRQLKVPLSDILYLKADHVYVEIHTVGPKKHVVRSALSKLLQLLPHSLFVQTHRSFVVQIKKVSHWNHRKLYINNTAIPLARSHKKTVYTYLEKIAS